MEGCRVIDTDESSMGPLCGLLVIDASSILAGPLACQVLGDFGADIIKIEHPSAGDGLRGHGPSKDGHPLWWKEVARNKRTVALDLSDRRGAELLLKLVATADVLVENFRPGTLERWGLGWDELTAVNPRLILLRVTGFGQYGPYSRRQAFGTLAEAMSGFAHLNGDPDGPPTLPPFGMADTVAGYVATSAIMMALYHRDARGGAGQVIDISILEAMLSAVGPGPTIYDQLDIVPMRTGNRSLNNAPRNLYATRDGHWVAVSTSALAVARRALEMVGHPEVVDEPWFQTGAGRVTHGDELDAYVKEWIGTRTRDEVTKGFEQAGAAVAPVYTAADIVADEQVLAREMITWVEDEDLGLMAMHNVLFRMSETPGAIRFTGRGLGADTDAILVDGLGLTPEAVASLRSDHVIA
jgi:crotonobetainyl-CoA:carnitine CoA-transferase CaiB-like acyl-CoA transferase